MSIIDMKKSFRYLNHILSKLSFSFSLENPSPVTDESEITESYYCIKRRVLREGSQQIFSTHNAVFAILAYGFSYSGRIYVVANFMFSYFKLHELFNVHMVALIHSIEC